jgi:hypothetical protein
MPHRVETVSIESPCGRDPFDIDYPWVMSLPCRVGTLIAHRRFIRKSTLIVPHRTSTHIHVGALHTSDRQRLVQHDRIESSVHDHHR